MRLLTAWALFFCSEEVFAALLTIGGTDSSSAPTQAPSTIPASSAPVPPVHPVSAKSSKAAEPGKKKKKKTTDKRVKVETISSPAREEGPTPNPAQAGHYGVNTPEE